MRRVLVLHKRIKDIHSSYLFSFCLFSFSFVTKKMIISLGIQILILSNNSLLIDVY